MDEQYEKYRPYRDVIMLFGKTGEYIGGCDNLFVDLPDNLQSCQSCKAQRLLEVYRYMVNYESNL
jgi:hypothetical protein